MSCEMPLDFRSAEAGALTWLLAGTLSEVRGAAELHGGGPGDGLCWLGRVTLGPGVADAEPPVSGRVPLFCAGIWYAGMEGTYMLVM